MISRGNLARSLAVVLGAGVLAAAGLATYRAGLFRDDAERSLATFQTYCTDCHNKSEATGGVVLEGLDPESIPAHAETFEAAIRKLRGRLMPPPGNPQPDQARVDGLVSWLERSIDSKAEVQHAAHVPVQRLNRAEYARSVEDLLGVKVDADQVLPTEIEVDGFVNIAAALSTSPAFLDQYIAAARTVARTAVGEREPKLANAYFEPPIGNGDDYVAGLPPGTRGGIAFEHAFPADGEYRLTITDLDVGLYPRGLETEQTLVVLVDRDEVFSRKLGGPEDLAFVNKGGAPARAEIMKRFADIPVRVAAGRHEIVVTFVERSRASTTGHIDGFVPYGGFSFDNERRLPRVIGGVEVDGPYPPTGLSRTESRDKLFICTPESVDEEAACAERITANLARRAFRRPVDHADVERLMAFYEAGRAQGSFDDGIEQMVTAVLASPDFLYRAIKPRGGTAREGAERLTDLELASRLSFFLWGSVPDDELLGLATQGKLGEPSVLETQIDRMLADPRAETLVTDFAMRWLNVDDLDAVDPNERMFPEFSEELRRDFSTEIRLFLESVLLEDKSVRELLTADYTFLDERLARHYAMSSVHGQQFRRVELTDETRYGLLGKAAVLLRTSYGDRTSPVLRGAWVLDKLMGTPPEPPPPDVNTDLSTPEGEAPKTIRVRLERHRTAPNCKGCHGVIDPYGLALENFTVTGQWRNVDTQADAPIDASTVLPGGVAVDGPVELRDALLARPDQFVQALTEKLMMYALGRELDYGDMPQVRAAVDAAAADDYRFSSIVKQIVESDAFLMQAPAADEDGAAGQLTASAAKAGAEE
jgi:hypothetical protein